MGDQGLSTVTQHFAAPRRWLCIQISQNKVKVSPSCCSPSSWNKCWQMRNPLHQLVFHLRIILILLSTPHFFPVLQHCPAPLRACREHFAHCFTSRLPSLRAFVPTTSPPAEVTASTCPSPHFLDLVLFDLSAASVTGDPLLFFLQLRYN